MARSGIMRRSPMLVSGIDYLEHRYPGIVKDCCEYRHERLPSGEEYLTVKLVVHSENRSSAANPAEATNSGLA